MAKRRQSLFEERFERASQDPTARIIGCSWGEVGTGKTSFWLGAPGPIVVQSLDKGLEGVVESFAREKEIYLRDYDWAPTTDLSQEDAIELRDAFIEDFEWAIQHARTVIWDKETDVYELFRYAEFGGPSDSPLNYPELYQRLRRYINMPKATSINFGLIQSMKDEWGNKVDSKSGKTKGFTTGARIRKGFSEVDGLVHIDIHHRREDGKFYIDIGKTRGPGSGSVMDQTFHVGEGGDIRGFVDFAQLVFPETSEEDWL